MNEQTAQETQDNNNNHPVLKKLGIIVLLTAAGLYTLTYISTYFYEKSVKDTLVSSNSGLTMNQVSIANVKIDVPNGRTSISGLTVSNPPGFNSPNALSVGRATMVSGMSSQPQFKQLIFTSVVLDDVKINYDVDSNRKVNLHRLVENISRSLATNPNSSTIDVLKSSLNKNAIVNYSGIEFYLDQVLIQKPVVNIYINNKLVKSHTLDDIFINYDSRLQPTNYGKILLATSVQVIEKIEQSLR